MDEQTGPAAESGPRAHTAVETVQVRRAPKLSVFLVLGGAVGVLAAAVLTFAFQTGADAEQSLFSAVSYTKGQVFGFLLLVCGTVGVALGGIVALVFEFVSRRRARHVRVDHDQVAAD